MAALIQAGRGSCVPAYFLVRSSTWAAGTAQLDMVRNSSADGCGLEPGEYRVKSADRATSLQAVNLRERSAGPPADMGEPGEGLAWYTCLPAPSLPAEALEKAWWVRARLN